MKKILIFSYQLLGTGGTESVLNAWSKNLESSADEYHIDLLIYGNNPDHSFLENKKIRTIPIAKGYDRFFVINKIRRIVKSGRYDIIICLGLNFLRAINYATRLLANKPKIIYWTHFRVEPNTFSGKTSRLLKNTDGILSLCEGMTAQFVELEVEKEKIHTIYNPIEKALFKERSNSGKRFWYVGRLDENQKRISDLIRVFYILKNEGHTDYTLDILGVGESLYYYVDMVKRFSLQNQIRIHDLWLRKPWDFIDEIDCLILSSNFEGFGLVICEAIARGIPVISSNCPVGPSDIIKPGVNGYLYDVGDLQGLRDRILQFTKEFSNSKEEIANSIDKMYTNNYFLNVKNILDRF
ncbi:glycosyltransferase [Salmonella enterica]|uniref:Glycosyltransferase n=2 Tax=Salmonella enterica TaxID=28901 RepID=A0A603XCG9_SALER|nr:glycosyltransferase [Salmonella enterica subsp. enterica serovar Java]EAN9729156.1 glycosyltransferase [Salmonella enterica]EBV8394804.1 glycosyltransferase [Salmonella enterica subsp. enterica serovar Virchow]EDQ0183453.1 glycosyltransferase [Salmonella enterica subsp. enterica serovar 4,[5],12:b:-]EDV9618110.1 glycosyltransferase [Salmonella enterica subsp. enterica serovar Paratyphi B]EEE5613370.1 glycosyltransferase [Salmonella enterica subsp. enterica serovar Typhimurium]